MHQFGIFLLAHFGIFSELIELRISKKYVLVSTRFHLKNLIVRLGSAYHKCINLSHMNEQIKKVGGHFPVHSTSALC